VVRAGRIESDGLKEGEDGPLKEAYTGGGRERDKKKEKKKEREKREQKKKKKKEKKKRTGAQS